MNIHLDVHARVDEDKDVRGRRNLCFSGRPGQALGWDRDDFRESSELFGTSEDESSVENVDVLRRPWRMLAT